jgi:hypothetical protein
MADAVEAKKIDPKAAKGMLIGAAASVMNQENSWRMRDNLRNAIRACEKAGVKREEIEKIVGVAVAMDAAPVFDDSPKLVAESSPYMSPVEKALAKLGSAKVAVVDKAFFAGFASGLTSQVKEAAKLTSKERSGMGSGEFALPGKRYPIEDKSHARNALARVSANGSPAEKAKVRSAVHSKFPDIGKK